MEAESTKDISLMDTDLLEIPVPITSTRNAKNRRRKARRKARKMAGSKNMDQMNENLETSQTCDCNVANNDLEKNLFGNDITVPPTPAEQPQMEMESTKELSEVNAKGKKKKKRKKMKKAEVVEDEVQSVDQNKINAGSTENLAEGDVNRKRKRKKKNKKKKLTVKDEVESMDQANGILNLPLSDGNLDQGVDIDLTENKCIAKESEISLREESISSDLHNKETPLESSKCEGTVLLSNVVDTLSSRVSSKLVEEGSGTLASPMELDGKFLPCESQHGPHPNTTAGENLEPVSGLNEVKIETIFNQGNCSPKDSSFFSTSINQVVAHLPSSTVKEAECLSKDLAQCPSIGPNVSIKRKLLVLDVNGLLAYIVMPAPKECRGDVHLLGRAIFRRPFCDDFLKFCFQNFDVGVWSSRSKKIIDKVVDYLLGNLREKLLFCWDMEHSTQTGFKTLENRHKPLVCKELRKIWENDDPNLPWKKGDYDESNTLLLDDSPYKALLNPLHTAIFPHSYHYEDKNDNSLGPGGDLRVYLEGVLASENVQKYVGQHPFGQSAINETDLQWEFYSGVLQTMADKLANTTLNAEPTVSSKT